MNKTDVARPSFDDAVLQKRLRELRRPDNHTNLLFLAREYACLILAIGGAVVFAESRQGWGLSWWWNVPVFGLAIVFIGALQHRLAGLGHESSHYSFLHNRVANDLVADVFCMFPILTSVHYYRVFHMAHHQYTNDPERDPDLLNLGRGKRAFEFPMTRERFVALVYLCFVVAPLRFVEYQFEYMTVNTFGKGKSVYTGTAKSRDLSVFIPRFSTILGIFYVVGLSASFLWMTSTGRTAWVIPAALAAGTLGTVVAYTLPDRLVFRSPFRQAFSERFSGSTRLWFFTIVFAALALTRSATDGGSPRYVFLLWLLPLITTFPFFMLLRDVYQHSNADAGRLTNSRVFFTDPFTHWAVFIYGQDMHIPHHLFPTVPHYRLPALHELLKTHNDAYRQFVIECHGTFRGGHDHPTILDEMTKDFPPLMSLAMEPH